MPGLVCVVIGVASADPQAVTLKAAAIAIRIIGLSLADFIVPEQTHVTIGQLQLDI